MYHTIEIVDFTKPIRLANNTIDNRSGKLQISLKMHTIELPSNNNNLFNHFNDERFHFRWNENQLFRLKYECCLYHRKSYSVTNKFRMNPKKL